MKWLSDLTKKQKKQLLRILISACLFGIILILRPAGWWNLLYLLPYLLVGYDVLWDGLVGIAHLQPLDEDFLMTVASVGALFLGEYAEGVSVMLLFQLGEWLEHYAVGKTRKSIGNLMNLRPDYARILSDGKEMTVSPDEVPVGSLISVRPGEKIPLDGEIVSGCASLDTSALTGESLPRDCKPGDRILSGMICSDGELTVKTTGTYGESTASKILDLVENAASQKSKSEQFISKFAKIYTPAVCLSALVLAFLPKLIGIAFSFDVSLSRWVKTALTFLVISCPCALVISVPLSYFAFIGRASRLGILFKGSDYLETLSRVSCVAFDKTGTLTKGNFVLRKCIGDASSLQYASALEAHSNHPVGKGILSAYKGDIPPVTALTEEKGYGISGVIDGNRFLCGNGKWMEKNGISYPTCTEIGTPVYLAKNSEWVATFLLGDEVKEDSADAVSELKNMNLTELYLLTGDREETAKEIAEELQIPHVFSQLLPDEKTEKMRQIIAKKEKNTAVAYVGDGINDAPVLALSDVGIAMGCLGQDSAIEAADVILMKDSPSDLPVAIRLARRCHMRVTENIVFTLSVKAVCLLLGIIGFASLPLAVFADVGVMLIAVLNALRK